MTTRSSTASSTGTFATLRQIFISEGFVGIYAGLAPTLVMSIPNTVLYFTTYDELSSRLKKRFAENKRYDNNNNWTVPLVAGSSARLLASGITAPFELIRTRQALNYNSSSSNNKNTNNNMWKDMRHILRTEGGARALYKGLAPTLWRDVPFSAIYWYHLEYFQRTLWDTTETTTTTSVSTKAYQSFVNGALAGMIAAACTTPFDVVKTRRQAAQQQQLNTTAITTSVMKESSSSSSCEHFGAKEVFGSNKRTSTNAASTFGTMQSIVQNEGLSGLWRGNTTRMLKVAPACAIMIS
eukprot:CAMPEP_0194240224 /NCGR_PEP_ID=MMETSP0158-20130606/6461_1 /TAXON_ID=33649 /ORGANISM="Thalassionema nitzschioides, Strain L26-B" /LENGTH=295 /DNA_ID=CAMNT_0038974881 /DNA_START=347 /DNA_END=1231 /DNA_ORIENTATION=+